MIVLKEKDFFKENGYLLATNSKKLYGKYHCHEFYEFVVVLEGEAVSVVENEKRIITAGEFTFLTPGSGHNVLSDGSKYLLLNVSVTREEMEKVLAFAETDADCLSRFKGKYFKIPEKEFSGLLENVYKINKTDSGQKILRIKNTVIKLILFMLESFVLNGKSGKNPLVERAMGEFSNPKNLCGGVEALASLSGYSVSRLYSIMKEEYGVTPYKYIEQTRISLSENMLKYSDRSISEIAAEAGFTNQSHFTRRFKSVVGVTPNEYRKKYGINLI